MGLFDIFTTRAADQAAADRTQGYHDAYNASSGLLDQGRAAATQQYGNAAVPYQTLFDQGGKFTNQYTDALGLNGPQASADALSKFSGSPGYQFKLNAALDANDRRAASRGMLASGNNTIDTLNTAYGIADQDWTQHLAAMQPLLGQQTLGAKGLGDTYAHLGNTLDSSYRTQAGDAYKTQTGIGDANAAAALDANRASGQTWGALMGGAQLLGGALGGFPGMTSGLTSMFGKTGGAGGGAAAGLML